MLQQREDVLNMLRTFGIPDAVKGKESEYSDLSKFIQDAHLRWESENAKLLEPQKNTLWYYSFGCQIVWKTKNIDLEKVRSSLISLRRYTWVGMFYPPYTDEGPYSMWGCMEVFLKRREPDDNDFWRIRPDGFIYFLCWHQEDSWKGIKPWTALEVSLPVWRLGEFLLIANQLWSLMFEEWFSLLITCEWQGTENRILFSEDWRRNFSGNYKCKEKSIKTTWKFSSVLIENLLSNVVKSLLNPFYEKFDFLSFGDGFYDSEITKLKTGRQ